MNWTKLVARTTLLACLPAGPLMAMQEPATQWMLNQRQGMHSAAPVGVLLQNTTGLDDVLIRSAGSPQGMPGPWSAQRFGAAGSEFPDFTAGELLAGVNRSNTKPNTMTDLGWGSVSTGGDVKPAIQINGVMDPDVVWHLLSVVVADKGNPQIKKYGSAGSTLESLTRPVGAILSYYLLDSAGLDTSLVHSTAVEQTAAQVGIVGAAAGRIAGIDWGMGAIASDPGGIRSVEVAPVRDRIYFSFTEAWALTNANLFEFVGAGGSSETVNAATIYMMDWQSDAEGSWGWDNFRVAYSEAELFGASSTGIEIDAISVYAHTPLQTTPETYRVNRVVLSTTLASQSPDQLLGWDSMNGSIAQPLKNTDHQLISEQLGVRGVGNTDGTDLDDVTGTTGTDPEGGATSGSLGIAMASLPLPGDTSEAMGISVFRAIESTTDAMAQDLVHMQASGIPIGSDMGHVTFYGGILPATASLPDDAVPPSWSILGVVPVVPGETTCDFSWPGNYGNLGPVSIRADYSASPASGVVEVSLISVLNY